MRHQYMDTDYNIFFSNLINLNNLNALIMAYYTTFIRLSPCATSHKGKGSISYGFVYE